MLTEQNVIRDMAVSPFYETEPIGYEEQPPFINIAVVGNTEYLPSELFRVVKDIEKSFGRKIRPRWHERELDIDIILFENDIINTPELIVPHPRMQERRFVLLPASDIAADMSHPLLNKTITELLIECTDTGGILKIDQ